MYKKIIIALGLLTSTFLIPLPASVLNSPYLQFTKQTVPPSYENNPSSYPSTMITKGQEVYKNIQSNSTAQLTKNNDTYMQSIIALMFFLYSKAVEKNQGFSNGAFVIKDPEFKLYNFLYGFVEKKWKPRNMFTEVAIDIEGIGAYPRKSTHLSDYYRYTNKTEKDLIGSSKKKEFTHYGIDLPKGYVLPARTRHILFAKEETSPPLTYIKIEEHGLGTSGITQHAGDLVKSKTRKYASKAADKFKKLDNAYLTKVLDSMTSSLGSDDSADSRRERVPAEPVTQFFALLLSEGSPVSKLEVDTYTKSIKALGIQGMVTLLDTYARGAAGSAAWKKEAAALAQELRNQYDHVEIRIGREVILTPEQELK